MSSESSKVGGRGNRVRSEGGSRRLAARQATLRRLSVDLLEPRQLLTALPPTVFDSTNPNNSTNVVPSAYQTTGAYQIFDRTTGNVSSPSIAVDPSAPQKLVAVWTLNDPSLAPGQTERVQYAYSTDGGTTWNTGGQPAPFATDPTTTNPQVGFAQATDASVQFDRNNNAYILWSEHNASNSSGEIRLQKFDFSGSTPTGVFGTPTDVYQWASEEQANSPVLAVDASLGTVTDTNSDGGAYSLTDPNAGTVYVAWSSVDQAPPNTNNFNPNRIELAASSDGGATFSSATILNSGQNFGTRGASGPQRDVTPQIVVSQGRPPGTNPPDQFGNPDPGVSPGQVTAVWDDWGSQANNGLDQIVTNAVTGANFTQTFNGSTGFIQPGSPIGTSGNFNPTPTPYQISVNVTDPTFLLSNLTATIAINAPNQNLNEFSVVLNPPPNSGLQPITLLNNQVNGAGQPVNANNNPPRGVGGNQLGELNGRTVGTTFDDNATRNIINGGNNFIGHYKPEVGTFSQYAGATAGAPNSPGSVNGTWTLVVTDYRAPGAGKAAATLDLFSLNLTSGLTAGQTDNTIASTSIRAPQSGNVNTGGGIAPTGLAPSPVIASDNTLGAYSPNQGNLYVAYVGGGGNGLAAGIRFAVATDGGQSFQSWTDPSGQSFTSQGGRDFGELVNDNNAKVDGYSGAGGGQFQPSIAVDQATGTLGLSWLDGRNDPSHVRVDTYFTTSIDGGVTFSPNVYANDTQYATDAITGNAVNLGPVGDAAANSGVSAAGVAYGTHQGLAMYGGQAHPIWSDDQNGGITNGKQTLGAWTNTGYYPAGPRVVSATQGPIGQPGDTINSDRAGDNTPIASAFVVTFDRPIDPASFGKSDAQVYYTDTNPGNPTGGFVPVTNVTALNTDQYGATEFQVDFAPRTGVGTYSLKINANDITDRIRTAAVTTTPSGVPVSVAASPNAPVGTFSTQNFTTPAPALPAGGVISNVTVTVNISTPDDSQINLSLVAPDGTTVPLVRASSGATGTNFIGTTFSSTDPNAVALSSTSGPYTSGPNFMPASPLTAINGKTIPAGSNWTLRVRTNFTTATVNSFSVTYQPATSSVVTNPGNPLDQNLKQLPSVGAPNHTVAWPGAAADFFATPMPITGTAPNLDQYGANAAPIPIPGTNPFQGPYLSTTLPLILPGPSVASTSVAGQPATADNLVVNGPVNSIDVTFDRDMNPATVTAASVLQVVGPAGVVPGPYTVLANPLGTDPNPSNPRTYRIGFPTQTVSGTYTVTLASSVTDANGNALDTNQNAGLALLEGTGTATQPKVYYAPATIKPSPTATPVQNAPVPIRAGTTTVSTINVPDSYLASNVSVKLNITYPNVPDLQVELVSPNNVVVQLVPLGTGAVGSTRANFQNTTFSDAAGTPIQNGRAPFGTAFQPVTPLSALNGVQVNGTWRLVVVDSSTNPGVSGTLNSWQLNINQPLPVSGLGEPVADQAHVSFRVFNSAPANPLASTTWTPVGPAPVAESTTGAPADTSITSAGFAGQATAIVVDPADPTGNTVYVGAASGGVWKTTDFLTNSPSGPTYIPLTNFGPTFGLNVGSIAIFDQNNDPSQSIILVGTGAGDTFSDKIGGNTSTGVGFLLSKDGGNTWALLDSKNNNLPFAQRDHTFARSLGAAGNAASNTAGQGVTVNQIAIDPTKTAGGGVVMYAAISAPAGSTAGGLWRSLDTGLTWQQMPGPTGNCTSVVLDLSSAPFNAQGQPTGNVTSLYAAFPGSGVYFSPDQGNSLNPLPGHNVDPLLISQGPTNGGQAIPVNNGTNAPLGGAGDQIVLARPTPPVANSAGADVTSTLYEGWLYAAVTTKTGLTGVYLTKDSGYTWTKLDITGLPSANDNINPAYLATPTNNQTGPNYNVAGNQFYQHGTYDIALAVDPTNPNVVYVGGTDNGDNRSGLIRIDASGVYDSHALVPFSSSRNDGGASQYNSVGRVALQNTNPAQANPAGYYGTSNTFTGQNFGPYLNLLSDPNAPFVNNSTLEVENVASFTNDGSGLLWTPVDQALYSSAASFESGFALPSTNIHAITSFVDPLTGQSRLIFADDQGVFTGEYGNNAALQTSVGAQSVTGTGGATQTSPGVGLPAYSRNGNLQTTQLDFGAAQPDTAVVSGQLNALFYGNGYNIGTTTSDPNVLTNGNTVGNGLTTVGDQVGTGIAVSQQGDNVVYRYLSPSYGGNGTDFFQYSNDGGLTFNSRIGPVSGNGLLQAANDPQWPGGNPTFGQGAGANAIPFGNFAVNPLNSADVVISSAVGRVFLTTSSGVTWRSIGEPTALDGSYAPALAFGAPDPLNVSGTLSSFIYAGTVKGNIFVTTTGGGGNNGAWFNISSGLDGSPVVKIVTDPAQGSHDAYAVTQQGVYYIADSVPSAANPAPAWMPITGNLFSLTTAPFGDTTAAQPTLAYLTSIQADWRYAIPNPAGGTPTQASPNTFPVLYVSGEGGVFRSLDNGATWTPFPSQAVDGAPVDGGYLPSVHVNDLSTSLGFVNTQNGAAQTSATTPDVLLATTYGQGQFSIRLAPLVLPNTVALSANTSTNGTDASGYPVVTTATPVFTGSSEFSGLGNSVYVTLYDLTDPTHPVIGGFDPNQGPPGSNPTAVPANATNGNGQFAVQVNASGFTTTGVHTIGIQATDSSGTVGNMAVSTIDVQAKLVSINPPAVPALVLASTSYASNGQIYTNVTTPSVTVSTDAGVIVTLSIVGINGAPTNTLVGTMTTGSNGRVTFTLPTLTAGTYNLQAVTTGPTGLHSKSQPFSFTVQTAGPAKAPTLSLSASSDTGIIGDNITSSRQPVLTGQTAPNAFVTITEVSPVGMAITKVQANGSGVYFATMPNPLFDGKIVLQATATDQSGNPAPAPSGQLKLTIVTVNGDFTGGAKTTPAVVYRNADNTITWSIAGSPTVPYGVANADVPFTGDFDGDGISDKALFRPTANAFFIPRSSAGGETVQFSLPGMTPQASGALSVPVVANFTGTGVSDAGVYYPTLGVWQILDSKSGNQTLAFAPSALFTPQAGDVPVPADYGNLGYDQLAVYRPSNATWYINGPNGVYTIGFGGNGVIPMPGDYNATATNKAAEPAFWNPATGQFVIDTPSGAYAYQFAPGDIPAAGDYNNVGFTEAAVFRPSAGAFLVASPTGLQTIPFGHAGGTPVVAPLAYRSVLASPPTLSLGSTTFLGNTVTTSRQPTLIGTTDAGAAVDLLDANGKVLATVTANGAGQFKVTVPTLLTNGDYTYQARSRDAVTGLTLVGQPLTINVRTVQGDYTGGGVTEPSLFLRAGGQLLWYVQNYAPLNGRAFGSATTSIPVVGDFTGSGRDDLMVYDPSTGNWTIGLPQTGYTPQPYLTNFGSGFNYVPLAGNFLGTGRDVAAVYENTTGRWFIQGLSAPLAPVTAYAAGDVPVPGSYDNTGLPELAVFRPSTATWYIEGPNGTYSIPFGASNDIPVPGVYFATAGSQATDLAFWNPANGQYVIRRPNGTNQVDQFAVGDVPAPGDYDGIGTTEAAVYRPSTDQFLVMGPNDKTPRALPGLMGGTPGTTNTFLPLTSPYGFRAANTTVVNRPAVQVSPALNFGATALSLSAGTPAAAAAAPAPAPSAASPTTARVRPAQQVAAAATTAFRPLIKVRVGGRTV